MMLIVFLVFNSFLFGKSLEKQKQVESGEKNADITEAIVSDLSSKYLEHNHSIKSLQARLDDLKIKNHEDLDSYLNNRKHLRFSVFGNVGFSGGFLAKEKVSNLTYYFPSLTFGNPNFVVGLKSDFILDNFKANVKFAFNKEIEADINLRIYEVKVSFFNDTNKKTPTSSDFISVYNSDRPKMGIVASYGFNYSVYSLWLKVLLGTRDIDATKKDIYLISLDNAFKFSNVILDIKLNYVEEVAGTERTFVITDPSLSGIFSLNGRVTFFGSFVKRSFIDINYATNVAGVKAISYGSASFLNSLPIIKINADGLLSMYTDIDLTYVRARYGMFETGEHFDFTKGKERKIFNKSPIVYKAKMAGFFAELAVMEGWYFTPEFSYSRLFNDANISYLYSIRSYFRVFNFNSMIDFGILDKGYQLQASANLFNIDYKNLFIIDNNNLLSLMGHYANCDFYFLKAHLINLKLSYKDKYGSDKEHSGHTASISYTNHNLSQLTEFFSKNDYITIGFDFHRKGLLILSPFDYAFHFYITGFKYTLSRLSIKLNGLLGSDANNFLYGASCEFKYLLNSKVNLSIDLGWLKPNVEEYEMNGDFETKFPKNTMKFSIEEKAAFRILFNFDT